MEEMEIWKSILKKIEETKNINNLPLIKELIKTDKEEDEDDISEIICVNWDCVSVTIADGTEVKLERCISDCFDCKDFLYYYYIESIDTYICAECGLWQKSYQDIKDELDYEEYIYDKDKLFPTDWNEQGVRAYLEKGIQYSKERAKKREERYNSKNNYYDDRDSDEECEDWEAR